MLVLSLITFLARNSASAEDKKGKDASDFPQFVLANDAIKLLIYLPDTEKGYYRGTRFDWSGLIEKVEYKGHTIFGPWKSRHDPANHDDADGTAEEFGMFDPLGYDEAKPGEPFLKIGVGKLEKPEEPKYEFWKTYKILEPGTWKIKHEADWIEFQQEVTGPRGWGYRYTKRITLLKDSPGFVIRHTLQNTGNKAISTTHYCHNFVIIDKEPVGPDYRLEFPFDAKAKQSLKETAAVKGRQLLFDRPIKEGESLFTELEGSKGRVEDNEVMASHRKAGVGIRIKGDSALRQFNFFAVKESLCPEPFIDIRLDPGKDMQWSSQYQFSLLDKDKGEAP
jgi:hypothetical protein